ncbi:MAG: alkaline phosphatase family protein [Gemmatimonadota bacterium]|nr:MAG: alkaline phosphatase family protein [Gemmatimonadota bacterium]
MRRFIFLSCIGTCLLAAACAEPALEKKVLVIGLDGVRPDVLAEVSTPNIDALIAGGAFNGRVETKAQTVSGPGWSSILTGVWPEKHRVTSNDFSGNDYANYPDFLTRLEQTDAAFTTFAVVDWLPLGSETSGGPLISDEIDAKLTFDGDELGYAAADSQSVAAAIRFLSNQGPDAAFVYIGYPDIASHEHGGRSPEYNASIALADAQVGQLLQAVRTRLTFAQEDWLILVVTDHGHKDEGGHGGLTPEEKTVFYLASGPSTVRATPADANLVDVTVTALAHLGVEIDASWGLDGKVSGLRTRR